MKKTLILLFIGVCTMVNAQNKKAQVVEELLKVTKVEESVPLIVNSLMNKFKQKRTDIPESYWKEIANKVDYSSFINGARKLYNDNYTVEELEELVSLFKARDMETYKQKSERITPQLYQVGNDFGQQTVQFIVEKMKAYKG